MAAVVLEDFCKPFFKELSHKYTQILIRGVVVIVGVLCLGKVFFLQTIISKNIKFNITITIKLFLTALVFVVERLGSVLQLTMSLSSATIGPKLGVFVIGMFIPFIDATVS